ncbi:hypothetical protein QBC44DRAFT_403536 [Cladorrhinum sp. PSN332]|nr:hypothetical protein QBC44DRAFT_403536 [Cladorrhinum sp. PSN332]
MVKALEKFRRWFRSSVSRTKPIDNPVSNGPPRRSNPIDESVTNDHPVVKITVVPALKGNLTREKAISQALASVSWIISEINKWSAKNSNNRNNTENLIKAIANAIIDIVNTIATVSNTARPRTIYPYHIFATRTAIANFLIARNAYIRHPSIWPWPGVDTRPMAIKIVTAYTYFGMAVLVTPEPYAISLAAAIAAAITDSMNHTERISNETAYDTALDIISRGDSADLSAPPPPPYCAPLESILDSFYLAGLARAFAVYTQPMRDYLAIEDVADCLDRRLWQFSCNESDLENCRDEEELPVCFCKTGLLSEKECKRYLLPGI